MKDKKDRSQVARDSNSLWITFERVADKLHCRSEGFTEGGKFKKTLRNFFERTLEKNRF